MSPFKTFASGEVLTASDLQTYTVNQSVMTFATSAARTTALPTPSQGMVSWLNDSGTAWQYFELYNASTNPGGAATAGWYPISGSALFYGTASRSATTAITYPVGASGFSYTELSDGLGWHDATTNPERMTPNVRGLYRMTVQIQATVNATGTRNIQLFKNGTEFSKMVASASISSSNNPSLSSIVSLNGSTDYVSASVYQDSGSSLTVAVQTCLEFLRPLTA